MERLLIIAEIEPNDNGTMIFGVAGFEPEMFVSSSLETYKKCLHFTAKKVVNEGCRYEFISQSQLPIEVDYHLWDYSNCDGIVSQRYTGSWEQYCLENGIE